MKNLIDFKNKKMSSKHIAERTGKRNSDVLRDIRKMISDLEVERKVALSDYQVVTRDDNGQTAEILLNERLSLCLAAGYSINLRMMIIDDWARMKEIASMPSYQIGDSIERAKRWIEEETERQLLAKDNEEKALQLQEQQPKVEFADMILSSEDNVDFGDFAKFANLGYGRNNLFETCRQRKLLMNDNKPYQKYIDSGYFVLVEQPYKSANGNVHLSFKTQITPKGQQWLIRTLSNSIAIQ